MDQSSLKIQLQQEFHNHFDEIGRTPDPIAVAEIVIKIYELVLNYFDFLIESPLWNQDYSNFTQATIDRIACLRRDIISKFDINTGLGEYHEVYDRALLLFDAVEKRAAKSGYFIHDQDQVNFVDINITQDTSNYENEEEEEEEDDD
jgi:hypothetical protein